MAEAGGSRLEAEVGALCDLARDDDTGLAGTDQEHLMEVPARRTATAVERFAA